MVGIILKLSVDTVDYTYLKSMDKYFLVMDAKNSQLSYELVFELVMISMIAGMQNECNFLIFVHR